MDHDSKPHWGADLQQFDLHQTRALLSAASAALRGGTFSELAARVAAEVRSALQCDGAALYERSTVDGSLALRYSEGSDAADSGDASVLGMLARAGAKPLACVVDGRSYVAVAVRSGTRVYGVMTATTTVPSGFGESDLRLVRAIAAILAGALRAERRIDLARSVSERSRTVFAQNPNPMMIFDAATLRFLDVNQSAVDVYGYTREQWRGMTPYDLRPPETSAGFSNVLDVLTRTGSSSNDARHRKADGSPLDAHLSVVGSERNGRKVFIVTVQDMTERNEALASSRRSEERLALTQRQFEHSALHDRLTGLPNRVLLHERLAAAIEHARVTGGMAAVLFIDVDEFKHVNDTLGHSAGDVLLREIGERLRSNTRHVDCIARVGGDEFIAVLGDIRDVDDVTAIARQLGDVIAEPLRLADREVASTCSIGVAMYPRDGDHADALIRNADTAMYRAKRDGRATARYFTPEMHDETQRRRQVEAQLGKALRDESFALVYQPIYDLAGSLAGSEALIRWPQSDGSVVQPNDFIPFAEQSGLIVPIGAWVLRTACRQNAAWNRSGRAVQVSVNVSAKQLADPHFLRTVQAALAESGMSPALLELELTETAMGTNIDRNAAVVRELRALGVRIAIDDFGTGYNSLSTLRSYAIDTLKLDRCFITEIAGSPVDRAIASAAIAAAHSLGARVVAEGIETAEQRAALIGLNCDCGQGFLFSKPLSPERFAELLIVERLVAA